MVVIHYLFLFAWESLQGEFHNKVTRSLGFGFRRKFVRTKTQQDTDKVRKYHGHTVLLRDFVFRIQKTRPWPSLQQTMKSHQDYGLCQIPPPPPCLFPPNPLLRP